MDFLYGFLNKRHQVHVDRRVVGWSAGRHVDHPRGGKYRHGLLEKSLIQSSSVSVHNVHFMVCAPLSDLSLIIDSSGA